MSPRTNQRAGYTLLEVIVAMFLVAVGVLFAAPLFVQASRANGSGGGMGLVGAAAEERLEILRSTSYGTLTVGGSLSSDVIGYHDDSRPDLIVRWLIKDNAVPPSTKILWVRAQVTGAYGGPQQGIVLTSLRGD